jgi:carbonic anhydrase
MPSNPIKRLVKGLRDYRQSHYCNHQDLFEQLSHGQKPRVLFITCSDSRIDPNLLTQTDLGELFVIRNAGNIIPPYGATNGGEGASVEYAIHALGIEEVIVCGHSHCGAMKGLLKLQKLEEDMPLVSEWLRHTEATRRLLKENYSHLEGEELIEMAVAENVLTQLENLRTYPVIHSRMHQGKLNLYGWIYQIENADVLAYNPDSDAFEPIHPDLPACDMPNTPRSNGLEQPLQHQIQQIELDRKYSEGWLSPEQSERIYRGSHAR